MRPALGCAPPLLANPHSWRRNARIPSETLGALLAVFWGLQIQFFSNHLSQIGSKRLPNSVQGRKNSSEIAPWRPKGEAKTKQEGPQKLQTPPQGPPELADEPQGAPKEVPRDPLGAPGIPRNPSSMGFIITIFNLGSL